MEAKKSFKSFRYKNHVAWKSERRGALASEGKVQLEVGSPPEFKGAAGVWSPEDMLVGSLNTCLMLTFLAFAHGKGVGLISYESGAEGVLENVEGKYRITEIAVDARVVVKTEADRESARAILDKVEENCFISNSITSKVKFSREVGIA